VPADAHDPHPERGADARMARVHLRTGFHALARAELETMAGRGTLDAPALVDLAEVRWRTGDLVGAGDAARACMDAGLTDTIVLCIAAEAAAAVGRANDARELAARVVATDAARIDTLFAGQPRSPVWPSPRLPQLPSARPAPPASVAVWGIPMIPPVPGTVGAVPLGHAYAPQPGARAAPAAAPLAAPAAAPLAADSPPRAPVADREAQASAAADLVDAQTLLARGEASGLAVRLSVVLREQPILAPAVLGVADEALKLAPSAHERASIHLVRADAYRLMGRETLSREAHQEASRALRGPQQPQENP
jgi:hypothetical protein